ncbi:MAG: hypothetical protein AAFZ92_06595 [Pseudomonadota bacterium]
MARQSETSEQLWLLDKQSDLKEHLHNIVLSGQQKVFIFSRELNGLLFNHQQLSQSISRIARASRFSEVKIVIEKPHALVESNHHLLKLAQRLPSKIAIKKLLIDPQDDYAFVIVDDDKLWLQHREDSNTGFANYDAKPEVKRFKTVFDGLWRNSQEDSQLRKLAL